MGAPIKEVSTLIGNSYTDTERAMSSIISKNKPPFKADTGSSFFASFPTIKREMCGITSPIQLIPPVIATADDVRRVAHSIVIVRNNKIFSPIDFASYSLKDRRFIRHLIENRGIAPITKIINKRGDHLSSHY